MPYDDGPKCEDCNNPLIYEGDLGAPGYGQNWHCKVCGCDYWKNGKLIIKWENVDPEVFNY